MIEKLKDKRVGLDVDGVLANFSAGVIKRANELGVGEYFPKCCHDTNSWDMSEMFSKVMKNLWNDPEFWLGLPVLENTLPLSFQPYCYITSRRVPSEVTKQWLDKNGFPEALVITVKNPKEKLIHIREHNIHLFVDDLYSTVREMRDAGVNALLMSAPYQSGHKTECEGLPTIKSLSEVVNYV